MWLATPGFSSIRPTRRGFPVRSRDSSAIKHMRRCSADSHSNMPQHFVGTTPARRLARRLPDRSARRFRPHISGSRRIDRGSASSLPSHRRRRGLPTMRGDSRKRSTITRLSISTTMATTFPNSACEIDASGASTAPPSPGAFGSCRIGR